MVLLALSLRLALLTVYWDTVYTNESFLNQWKVNMHTWGIKDKNCSILILCHRFSTTVWCSSDVLGSNKIGYNHVKWMSIIVLSVSWTQRCIKIYIQSCKRKLAPLSHSLIWTDLFCSACQSDMLRYESWISVPLEILNPP